MNLIIVRAGKGDEDRMTILPETVKEPLRTHLERVEKIHEGDLVRGFGEVWG